MNDTIVQDVRDARAAFAERFGYDRSRIIAWAREQTKARKAAAPLKATRVVESEAPKLKPIAPNVDAVGANA